jgi:hypothetical protein
MEDRLFTLDEVRLAFYKHIRSKYEISSNFVGVTNLDDVVTEDFANAWRSFELELNTTTVTENKPRRNLFMSGGVSDGTGQS